MKKNMVILAFCTLVIGGPKAASCEMVSIPETVIARERATCLQVLPGLQANLPGWVLLAKEAGRLQSLERRKEFERAAKASASIKEIERLFPLILPKAQTLSGTLKSLQNQYPALKSEIVRLLGIEKEMAAIKDDLAFFIAYSQLLPSACNEGSEKKG